MLYLDLKICSTIVCYLEMSDYLQALLSTHGFDMHPARLLYDWDRRKRKRLLLFLALMHHCTKFTRVDQIRWLHNSTA